MSNIISYLLTARNQTGPAFQAAQAGLQSIQGAAQTAGAQLSNLKSKFDGAAAGASGFKTMLGGLAGLATGGFLVGMVKGTVEANAELGRLSKFLGISVETLSATQYAFASVGVKADAFADVLKELAKKQREAQQGNQEFLFYFKQMGVSVDDLKKKDVTQLLSQMADGWNELRDGPNKASLALKLFEDKAQSMQQVLQLGSTGIKGFTAEAQKLGIVLTEKTTSEALKFDQSLVRLKASLGPLAQELTTALLPAITTISEEMLTARKNSDGWGSAMVGIGERLTLGERGTKERLNNLQHVNAQRSSNYLDSAGRPSILSGLDSDNNAALAVKLAAKKAGMTFDAYLKQELDAATAAVATANTTTPSSAIPAGLPPLVDASGKPLSGLPAFAGGNMPPLPGKGGIPMLPLPGGGGAGGVGAGMAGGLPTGTPTGTRDAGIFDGSDTLAARIAKAQAEADAVTKIWVASYSLQKSQLKDSLDQQQVSYADYYSGVSALEKAEIADSLKNNEAAIERQLDLKAHAKDAGERYAAESALNNLYADRSVLVIKLAQSDATATESTRVANKTLAQQMSDLASQAAELQNNNHDAAVSKLEAQYGEIERLAKINGLNTDQITAIKNVTLATADLKDAQRDLALAQSRAGNAELAIQGLILKGVISQATAEERLEEIRKGAAGEQLAKARKILESARKTGNEQDVLDATKTVADLENVINAVSQKTRDFWDNCEQQAADGGASILRGFQSGTKSGMEAMRGVVKGIFQSIGEDAASNISKTIARTIRETIMASMAGGSDGGGVFGSFIKSAFSWLGGARAAGGSATGITLVGEHGPELVNFGQSGGTVLNAARTQLVMGTPGMASGGGVTHVHFHGIKDGAELKRSMTQIQAQLAGAVASGRRNT